MSGKLLIIGGGLETVPGNPIIKRFYDEVGGCGARVLIIPTASHKPSRSARRYAYVFGTMGMTPVVADIRNRDDANEEKAVKMLEKADGVFFTGGDQLRLTSVLGGSMLHEALIDRFREGMVVAGTSAGAAAVPDVMIAYGEAEIALRKGSVRLAPGLGFLEDAVVDTHFVERNRIWRLLQVVTENPQIIGLGIAEDTAVVADGGDVWEVIGEYSVVIIDGREIKNTNIPEIEDGEPIGVTGVVIHVLTHGARYDREKREAHLF